MKNPGKAIEFQIGETLGSLDVLLALEYISSLRFRWEGHLRLKIAKFTIKVVSWFSFSFRYTMSKTTAVIFILLFSIIFKLEKFVSTTYDSLFCVLHLDYFLKIIC